MIKEIKLENWKSFEESVLFVDPLTILIGTNGSGKSNILDAFSFLHGISGGKTLTSVVNGDQENEGIRGGSEWIINKQASSTSLSVVISTEHDSLVEYVYSISLGITDDQRVELLAESLIRQRKAKNGNVTSTKKLFYTNSDNLSDPSIITYFYSSTSGRGKRLDLRRSYSILSQSKSLTLLKEVQIGINVVSNALSGVFVLDPIPANMRRYSRISDKLLADASNIAGVIAGHSVNGSTGQLERAIRKYLAVLPENNIQRIWAEKVGKFEIDAMLYCDEILVAGSGMFTHYVNGSTQPSLMDPVEDREESTKIITVDARGISDGTLRLLGILTALLTVKEKSLVIIEEIDNGLHPSRADLLVKMLKEIGQERSVDVICTTHNPALLDALGNEMIPFISVAHRNSKTGASEITLLEELKELPRLMARGSLGKLATRGLIENALN